MIKLLLVGTGGFAGSILRYLVSGFVQRSFSRPWFPYGTLAVNLIGCLFIGFFMGLAESRQLFTSEMRLFLFIGFFGGFTTFSTFGLELFTFLRDGQINVALVNMGLHLGLGIIAVGLGQHLSRLI